MEHRHQNITIRTELQPGDIGYITFLHGSIYGKEFGYGIAFETYVAKGFYEFYSNYDKERDCVWICEDEGKIIGSLLLMHREENAAQLRYFLLAPGYRNIGLGSKLLQLFLQWLKDKGYTSAYLWTTHEQEKAAALYKSLGFELTEEFESTAFGKPLTEQRYDLHLV